MPTLDAGFGWTLVYTMIELSSTRPTTSSGQTAPATKLTNNGWAGGDSRQSRDPQIGIHCRRNVN
jgi:hypothetical protein